MANITQTSPAFRPLVATIGDPAGTRTVTAIVALLVALGLALLMVAVWMFRRTRPDPELLAPLEAMGERKWLRRDPVWQRRRLDELRPNGARPLDPSAAPPDVDEAFDRGHPAAAGFEDLQDQSVPPEGEPVDPFARPPVDPTPTGGEAQELPPPVVLPPPVLPMPEAANGSAGGDQFVDLAGREIDPEVLAAAMAELDDELRRWSDTAGSG